MISATEKLPGTSGKANSSLPGANLVISGALKTFITPEKVELNAVDDVSFTINQGEFFVMLGPSGCGKTTLLRSIAGLETLDAGSITLGSQRIDTLAPHQRPVNTVFQSYALFPHLTVAQNIAFGLEMERKPKAEVAAIVEEMLALVRLTDLASRKPAQLSGGQQQRVALARALAKKPLVLLLDEPLAALDLKLRRGMQAELKRLQETTGITFVFVTHDQEEALSMGDRIAVFNSGKPVQIGTPEEIYEQPVNRFVADFIGESNFITAPVSEKGGKKTIQLDGGDVITLPHNVAAVEGKVTIAIRPERISLNAAEPKLATGIITNIVYMGTDLRCTVRLQDGTDVAVRVPPPFGVDLQEVGTTVTLSAASTSIRPMAPEAK